MRLGLRGATLLALALLGGCAGWRPAPIPDADPAAIAEAWSLRQQQLGTLEGFEAAGRVAVRGGGLAGALRWQQQGEHFAVRIVGPFGAGALSMQGTPAEVAIKGKDIDLVTTEPAQVLAARTGWRLPLDALRWWVLGLPAPVSALHSEAALTLDDAGRALSLQQDGWTLRYSDYRDSTTPSTPGRIEAQQGDWLATLVIDSLALKP